MLKFFPKGLTFCPACGIILEQSARAAEKQKVNIAGWSSLVARRAHNPKVVGSNPAPATTKQIEFLEFNLLFLFSGDEQKASPGRGKPSCGKLISMRVLRGHFFGCFLRHASARATAAHASTASGQTEASATTSCCKPFTKLPQPEVKAVPMREKKPSSAGV